MNNEQVAILKKAIQRYGKDMQLNVAIEEISKLKQRTNKACKEYEKIK